MGRNVSTQSSYSDVAYALCSFGGNGGNYYRLLDANFKPARRVPGLVAVAAPISVSQYASYGTVAPSGFGAALDPAFALGAWSGYANGSGNSTFYDGLLQQAIVYGGGTSQPSMNNGQLSHYTGRTGEFGHDLWHLDPAGAIRLPLRAPSYGYETKTELNDAFVNADLADPPLALLLWSGALYLCRRSQAEDVIVSNGAAGHRSKWAIPGIHTGFYGTASYNRTRGELVIVGGSSSTSTTGMWMRLYRNVPEITATTDLNAALSAITPTEVSLASWPGWAPANNAEAVGGCTPVLTDNGDVFLCFFNAGTALYVVRAPRTGDTTFGAFVNHVSYGVTTSYGRHNARGSGMQVMQTRDGNTVAAYCQYYYYGAGLGVITINKRTSSARVMYSDSETGNGRSVLHWGQSGFAVAFNASGSYSASSAGAVYGFDCSVQTASVSPAQITLPIPNGYNTGAAYPFYVEVSA